MPRMKDYAVIQALNMSDAYLQNIAAELGVHSKTVSGALRRGSAPSRLERRRGGKLDAHEATVDRLRL